MVVNCNDFPNRIDGFKKDDCWDDEFVHFCKVHNGHLICIGARNLEKEVDFDKEVTKTWSPEGFGRLEGDNEVRQFSVGSSGHMGFSDKEIVDEMEMLVSSFDDEEMLKEVIGDIKRRRETNRL